MNRMPFNRIFSALQRSGGELCGRFPGSAAGSSPQRGRGALVCLLALYLFLQAFPAAAETPPETDVTAMSLDELLQVKVLKVYGVSRYEQSAHEAPAQVTVVTAEEIRRYGYRVLSDLLKGVTGLYVTDDRNYRYLGYRGFSVPGDYNSRVLVMIDGVRLNDEVYHQAPIGFDFPLDLQLVERVEIIRGPSQAIYGNNAFLLVINVITRTPPGSAQAEAGTSVDTRGLAQGRLTVGGPVSKAGAGLLLSGSLFENPGSDLYFPAYNDPATNNGLSRGCDYGSGGSAFFKYDQARFSLLAGYLKNRKGIPTGAYGTTFNDSSSKTMDERFFSDFSYHAIESASGSLKLRSYLNAYNYDGSYAYKPDPNLQDYSRALTAGAELVGNIVLPWQNILAGGIDYRHGFTAVQGDSSGYRDSRTVNELGVFVQDEYRPFEPLILTGSVRYDHLNAGLQTLNPKAAAVWLPAEGLALKYLFGRSFRAPNAYERYYGGLGYSPNPLLKEEVMYSNELVAEYQIDHGITMMVTGFNYDYRDLINQQSASDGNLQFINSGKIRTRGVESEISANWQQWSGSVGHTYQNTAYGDDPGRAVTNSPRNLLKVHLSRELFNRRLIVSGELNYTSRIATLNPEQDAPDYLVANLTFLGKNVLVNGLDASLSIYNLFDRRYSQPGGNEHLPVALIPQDGITAGLRLNYRFR
jgi:outer membrane receptor protein involved in Fe transport